MGYGTGRDEGAALRIHMQFWFMIFVFECIIYNLGICHGCFRFLFFFLFFFVRHYAFIETACRHISEEVVQRCHVEIYLSIDQSINQ